MEIINITYVIAVLMLDKINIRNKRSLNTVLSYVYFRKSY